MGWPGRMRGSGVLGMGSMKGRNARGCIHYGNGWRAGNRVFRKTPLTFPDGSDRRSLCALGLASSSQRLANGCCSFRVRRLDSFQQTIRGDFEVLGNSGEAGHGKRIPAAFDAADGLPVNANQFRQTLLRQTRTEARVLNVLANTTKDLAVVHS